MINSSKWLTIVSFIVISPMILLLICNGAEACCAGFPSLHESAFDAFRESLKYKLVFLYDFRVQLLLATPIQFIIGAGFYKKAYYAIRNKALDTDFLVTIGTSVIYFYSLYISLFGIADASGYKKVYYESSMFITTIVLLKNYLEEVIKRRYSVSESKLTQNDLNSEVKSLFDKINRIFVLLILLISIATFVIWYFVIFHKIPYFLSKSIIFSVCVLVVACPYEFKLAMPGVIKTKWEIGQNLVFAFSYNLIAIIFAVTGRLTPVTSVFLMSSCSLLILINYLRLSRVK